MEDSGQLQHRIGLGTEAQPVAPETIPIAHVVERQRLSSAVLRIDEEREVTRIGRRIREILRAELKRRGVVVAISGGVDSAVCAALCVKALGREKVFGLLLPEKESSSSSLSRGKKMVEQLGIDYAIQDITGALEALGCYRLRDAAIRDEYPEYGEGWRSKIAISGKEGGFNHFVLIVESPAGQCEKRKLRIKEYLQIIAATNYKQRVRKAIEYFHADRLHYAVVGTPNRLEYDQGFFVKNGDGSADIKPIAHLYKTQVYSLARYLGVPEEICNARPTTDTYSLAQGQDEFYFVLPYEKMDLALWAHNHDISAQELSDALGIDGEMAEWIYTDIEAKRCAGQYLHASPALVDPL